MSGAADIGLGVGLAALVLATSLLEVGPPGPSGPLDLGAVALAAAAGATVAFRLRFPATCLLVVNVITFAWFHFD